MNPNIYIYYIFLYYLFLFGSIGADFGELSTIASRGAIGANPSIARLTFYAQYAMFMRTLPQQESVRLRNMNGAAQRTI